MKIKHIVCINLKHRKDRKNKIKKQVNKRKLNILFFNAIYDKVNPAHGCFMSHIGVIQMAKEHKWEHVLILEYDAKFIRPANFSNLPTPPKWDLLYLGGNVANISPTSHDGWLRANKVWQTHAYILPQHMYDVFLAAGATMEYDTFIIKHIQPHYECYIVEHEIVRQATGYSDIEQRCADYDIPVNKLRTEFPHAKYDTNENGDIILKCLPLTDDELPTVSIVTPTYHRRNFFPLAIHNFNNFAYPRDKLEWIIVDDSTDVAEDLSPIIPNDLNIKYIKIKTKTGHPISIAGKRNLCAQYATNDIIVHMDDDDYYFPHSVLSRVNVLISNKVNCVGCCTIGCYDTTTHNSHNHGRDSAHMAEATLCYTKTFWRQRQYDIRNTTGEGVAFLAGRENEVVQMPYMFVMISITHGKNISENLRSIVLDEKERIQYDSLFNFMDTDAQEIIKKL